MGVFRGKGIITRSSACSLRYGVKVRDSRTKA